MDEREIIGLPELQEMVSESLEQRFAQPVWLRAEISEIKENRSGHCYLTIVERDADSGGVAAKASAIIWSSAYRMLKPYFESQTGKRLEAGMTVLLKVNVQYSPLYGLSLIVSNIDPSFTVGELEAQRLRTIETLRKEGMFEMNSTLELPSLPRRFAVISSETAAGYRDFMRQLHENEYGYVFETVLFPSLMQGADCPAGIISALERIALEESRFDAVLILRGGGGAMDMVCFDDYELAANVAQFPLPVMTAIGHDHDRHVIDMVAHTSVKTPTALADFILDLFASEEYKVDSLAQRLRLALQGKWGVEYARLERIVLEMRSAVSLRFLEQRRKLDAIEMRIAAADPSAVLSRGFALVLKDGRKVDSVDKAKRGDRLTVLLGDGEIEVEVL